MKKVQLSRTNILIARGLSRLIEKLSIISRWNSYSNTSKSLSECVWLHNKEWYLIELSLCLTYFVG